MRLPGTTPPTARVHLLLSPLNFSSETCHRLKQYRNAWPWKLKVPPNSLPPPPQKASVVTGLFNRQQTLCLRTSLRIGPSPYFQSCLPRGVFPLRFQPPVNVLPAAFGGVGLLLLPDTALTCSCLLVIGLLSAVRWWASGGPETSSPQRVPSG